MLAQLYIENIALINKLSLDLTDGLNILSGETGAGKSIIIDSLNFVLGERADKSLIRFGTDFAIVQAVFSSYENDAISAYLDEFGIDADDVLILRRKMTLDGKNECRINGRIATLGTLRGLSELLVDIHGQHEHQSLLKTSNHIELLDCMGGSKLLNAKNDVAKSHREYHRLKGELNRFGDSAERARKLDVLNFQIDEIHRVDVKDGELEELLSARKRVRNIEKILSALEGAKTAIDGYDGLSVDARLKNAISTLNPISEYDEEVSNVIDRLDGAKVEIRDISDTLGELLERLDFDSNSAQKIEDRLEDVRNILRKYGGDFEAMQKFLEEAEEEAQTLANADDTVEKIQLDIEKDKKSLIEKSALLTKLRSKCADDFEKAITRELKDLGMGGSTFKVSIESVQEADAINANGADNVEFLISPNTGEPLKPLAKIISGGEMSRFMLALKNIVAGIDGIQTMVFDEIDTGISGNISAVVAEKMCNISRNRQVIAVTHMPSLASMADSHYLISKSTQNQKTLTNVVLLEDDTNEIARLIGGDGYSKYAIPHAHEMKAWAERYKQSLTK